MYSKIYIYKTKCYASIIYEEWHRRKIVVRANSEKVENIGILIPVFGNLSTKKEENVIIKCKIEDVPTTELI